jgi:hypothetical protein
MNKAQDIIQKIKRYQFWILCGLATVVGIVSWWLATDSLAKTYAANKTKIESSAGQIVNVKNQDPHPNEKWAEIYKARAEKDRKEVEAAWKNMYSEQKSRVYVWPRELGDDFVAAIENLPPGEELSPDHLNRYLNGVLRQFETLAKIVDADYVGPSQGGGGLYGSDRGAAAAQSLLGQTPRRVIWSGLGELQLPYDWQETPTTLKVIYAQEEIWVLQAICKAIAMANEGSTGPHDATVTMIEQMLVGYLAAEEHPNGAGEAGRITRVTAPLAPVTGYGAGGVVGASPDAAVGAEATLGVAAGALQRPPRPDITAAGGSGRGGGSPGYGGTGSDTSAAAPVSDDPKVYLNEWRYVKGDSTPLRADEFTSSPPFYEYRLMPWRVRMTVDERQWDKLLVMFRNTELPLEIKQVRVNPSDDVGGGMGSRYAGDSSSRGGYGGGGSRGGYGAAGGSRGGHGGGYGTPSRGGGPSPFGGPTQPVSNTVILELRGVAYLMNPPDLSKIGVAGGSATGGDAGAAAATATADPFAAPATATPAPGAPGGGPPTTPGGGYGGR